MNKKLHNGLIKKSFELRKNILKMIYAGGSGHPGGSLSIIDILMVLYDHVLKHNPKNPLWEKRDRVILSAGHLCPALYVTLENHGYYKKDESTVLRKFGSKLQGHPEKGKLPGIENTSGPLGQGLSVAVGFALAAKLKKQDHKIYCICSEGDHQEGATWEAIQIAAHQKLNNLCVIIDRNMIQIDGFVEQENALLSLKKKYHSFGWDAVEIDGHNIPLVSHALKYSKLRKLHKPLCIIAHTTLGKGVSFMQDNPLWHGKTPNKEQLTKAIKQLDHDAKSHHLFRLLKKRGVLR